MSEPFRAQLKKWGFKPISDDGHPLEPASSSQTRNDEESREIARTILAAPDVKI